ncbi:MAG: HPF/RaiA family ribosome-associated protein [Alphaproteobacteria bacterium]
MDREPQITFKNIPVSEALENLIRERITRLERFHPHITGCRVVIEVPHAAPESAKKPLAISVEVDVPTRPRIVVRRSESQHEAKGDRYAFMNWAFDAVQRRLEDTARVQRRDVKRHGPSGVVLRGTISRLFKDEEYGFIEVENSPDLYFTRMSLNGTDFDALEPGMEVEVMPEATEGPMGPQARSVRLVN